MISYKELNHIVETNAFLMTYERMFCFPFLYCALVQIETQINCGSLISCFERLWPIKSAAIIICKRCRENRPVWHTKAPGCPPPHLPLYVHNSFLPLSDQLQQTCLPLPVLFLLPSSILSSASTSLVLESPPTDH